MIAKTALALFLLLFSHVATYAATTPAEFRSTLAALSAKLDEQQTGAVKGLDGWYFLTNELRSYGKGEFWGDAAKKTSAARKNQDPLPVILEFHRMLKSKGVELILVPVPGKVCIYPDKLNAALTAGARLDEAQQTFCALLAEKGLTVVDLVPDFLELRKKGIDPYCRQDSHWSPAGMHAAVSRIAGLVKKQSWYSAPAQKKVDLSKRAIEIAGDLLPLVKDATGAEKLSIEEVKIDGSFLESDDHAALIVMGDSHALVFHQELLADHAGLPDLLSAETGLSMDVTAVQGSGANGSRAALARRKDNLAGKKCVVWCFSAREFTESSSGWQPIPVVR